MPKLYINMCNFLQASAKRHGINLRQGSSILGNGDCAFEAIIQNINNRTCYKEKFHMSTNYYRRIWVTDMANRTINTPLRTVTPKQWLEDWQQMLVPGTYERGIYGDQMLPGFPVEFGRFYSYSTQILIHLMTQFTLWTHLNTM